MLVFSEKAKAELTKHTVFTEYLKEENEDEQTFQNDLYFDLSYFKANRKVKLIKREENETVLCRWYS